MITRKAFDLRKRHLFGHNRNRREGNAIDYNVLRSSWISPAPPHSHGSISLRSFSSGKILHHSITGKQVRHVLSGLPGVNVVLWVWVFCSDVLNGFTRGRNIMPENWVLAGSECLNTSWLITCADCFPSILVYWLKKELEYISRSSQSKDWLEIER